MAYKYKFPTIFTIQHDYSIIPATLASSERVFNAGGNLVTKRYTRISSETIRYILYFRAWGLFVETDIEEEIEIDDEEKVIYIYSLDQEIINQNLKIMAEARVQLGLIRETPVYIEE